MDIARTKLMASIRFDFPTSHFPAQQSTRSIRTYNAGELFEGADDVTAPVRFEVFNFKPNHASHEPRTEKN